MLGFVRQLKTSRESNLECAEVGEQGFGAVYVIDVRTIRGSIGRLELLGHQHIINRISDSFRPVFDQGGL